MTDQSATDSDTDQMPNENVTVYPQKETSHDVRKDPSGAPPVEANHDVTEAHDDATEDPVLDATDHIAFKT